MGRYLADTAPKVRVKHSGNNLFFSVNYNVSTPQSGSSVQSFSTNTVPVKAKGRPDVSPTDPLLLALEITNLISGES